ncbi:MAG: rod shape-determining protein MreD [SAR86 cluster bacterium]|jgi:rod shape-determining protein MreD|tara:strand:+ start:11596 stop:12087 length:492 start_codon:yes stop_codon:yes gene_type:complete
MRSNNLWFVVFSFVIALVLSIVSLPAFVPVEFGFLRPHWVALVLIYWVIALPYRIGIVVAWMLGIILDILTGSLIGQHAISLIVVAYLASSLYQRLRMFAIWQQSLVVFAIIGLNQLSNFWIESISGAADWHMWYLLPSLVSALVWPWVFLVLRSARRLFHVT